jgi:hypothetical protein
METEAAATGTSSRRAADVNRQLRTIDATTAYWTRQQILADYARNHNTAFEVDA